MTLGGSILPIYKSDGFRFVTKIIMINKLFVT